MINVFTASTTRELDEVNNLLIPSLEKQSVDEQIKLTINVYDGKGKDLLFKNSSDKVLVEQIHPDKPTGFGESHNNSFLHAEPKDFFIITNPVFFNRYAIEHLISSYSNNNEVGIIEARQLPFSHPKSFNNNSKEIDWGSGCTLLIDSKMFSSIGMFDQNFWMYLEDVDLSWRSWLDNKKVILNNDAAVYHYTGVYHYYQDNRYYIEHYWSFKNFFYLMEKYFGPSGYKRALKMAKNYPLPNNLKKTAIDSYEIFRNELDWDTIRNFSSDPRKNNHINVHGFNLFSKIDEEEV